MLIKIRSVARKANHLAKVLSSCQLLQTFRNTETDAVSEQRRYTPRRAVLYVSDICPFCTQQRRYTPRRAVLYVPGNDRRKIDKVASLDVDCVVLDCEDGVALNRKEEARATIREVLEAGAPGLAGKDCSVRVNDVSSGLCLADLEEVLAARRLPDTLHLPKVETPDQVHWFIDQLKRLVPPETTRPMDIILFTESAIGMLNLRDICERTVELTRNSPLSLDGIVFGSDDYCADIGASRTSSAAELLFARQNLVMIAKAFKLQAIDAVYIDYKDLEGLRRQSEEGAQFGFTGKQVIHPAQVPVVQAAFSPTPERTEWARQLVTAFQRHQDTGQGAFTFRGHMIDRPLLLQAQNVLRLTPPQSSPDPAPSDPDRPR